MNADPIEELTLALREFARERDWEKFHAPKNLAMAVMIEAAEIAEHFQWLTVAESDQLTEVKRGEVAMEIADTLLYLLRLADVLRIDVAASAREKMALNAGRYPIDKSRSNALKYTEL